MSVSNVASSLSSLAQQLQSSTSTGSSLSSLLERIQSARTASSSQSSGTESSTSSLDDPAYEISLGRQQAADKLLGYSDLGRLVRQAGSALSDIDDSGLGSSVLDGAGRPLTVSHRVDIRQLAQAQVLTSAGYADPTTTSIGTGTVTVRLGAVDPASGDFVASGVPLTVSITDGTLDGVAAALNDAGIGLTASVVRGSDGQYRLQVAGETGAAKAFSITGIEALSFDPEGLATSPLAATQVARDARYSVDGGALQASPSNTVAIAGVTATFTAPGTVSVAAPFGSEEATAAAQTLVDTVNALLARMAEMTASDDEMADVASGLSTKLLESLGQTFAATKSSLADIGITIASDGSLALDSAKLQEAFAADPKGTGTLIAAATDAARETLDGAGGEGSDIQSQLSYYTVLMSHVPSLADFLNGSGNDDPYASLFGQSGTTADQLVSQLQSSSTSSSDQDSQLRELLEALGYGSSSTATDAAAASGTSASQAVSSYNAASILATLLSSS